MTIVVDARLISKSGIGYYTRIVIFSLYDLDLYIFGDSGEILKYFKDFPEKRIINTSNNKLKFNLLLNKWPSHVDFFLCPHIFVPLRFKGALIITVHDLVQLSDYFEANRFYKFIYKIYLNFVISKSKKILTVSNFSKNEILEKFRNVFTKTFVLKLAITDEWLQFYKNHHQSLKQNYFVLIGNLKKHKNIQIVIDAFLDLRAENYKLFIVGTNKGFFTNDKINPTHLNCDKKNIYFLENLQNEELKKLLLKSRALIMPTLYEGFGIPPLEAISVFTIPIISSIPVFHEIYGNIPYMFDPLSALDLTSKMKEVINLSITDYKLITYSNHKILEKYHLSSFKVLLLKILTEK
jgi:glycosyltransferase involved in cell wall biosynthesis